jgi:hypothetical protein
MLKHRCISAALFALALAGCQGRGLQPQSTSAATPQTNETMPTVTSLPVTTEPQSSTTVETTSTTAEIIPETVPVTSPRATVPATTARTTASTTAAVEPQRASAGATPPEYIKQCESGGDYRAVNPNGHYGAWQFSMSTWRSVGGTGNPADASPAEQGYRAAILWANGAGAHHWECA